MTWPLTQPPSGPTRKATTPAMSSGWPSRPSGLRDLAASGVFVQQGGAAPAHDLVVVVRGLENYGHYIKFRELLKNGPKGVRRVRTRLIAWREAEFAVTVQGKAESFAGDLKQTGQFTPEMIDISRGRIEGTISSERIR